MQHQLQDQCDSQPQTTATLLQLLCFYQVSCASCSCLSLRLHKNTEPQFPPEGGHSCRSQLLSKFFRSIPSLLTYTREGKKSEREGLKFREQRRSFEGQTGSREMERKHTRCTRRLLSSHRAIIPAIQSGSTLCLTNNGTRRSRIHTRTECACRELKKTPQ